MAHTIGHSLAIIFSSLVKGLVLLSLWVLIGVTGFFFLTQLSSPLNLICGLPLVLIGFSMSLQELYVMIVSIVSSRWRRTHCPFCKTSEEILDILSPQDAFNKKEISN